MIFHLALSLQFLLAVEIPPLDRPVIDAAGLLESSARDSLESALREWKAKGGAELGVLTLESLEGEAIEAVSLRTAEKWKLGSEDKDNGVVLLVAKKEKQLRIETGQGVEGTLTDALSKRIIEKVIIPHFRSGDYSTGILQGGLAILKVANPEIDAGERDKEARYFERSRLSLSSITFFSLFALFMFFKLLLLLIGSARPHGLHRIGRSRSAGWGGGGGSFGGGGWGGGGGGFSGGGASGKW